MLGLDLDRGLLEAGRKPAEAETWLYAALRCSVLGHLREPRPERNQAFTRGDQVRLGLVL